MWQQMMCRKVINNEQGRISHILLYDIHMKALRKTIKNVMGI
jgi:hypothetical protein